MKIQIRSAKGFGAIEIVVAVVVIALIGAGAYLFWQSKNEPALTEEQAQVKDACRSHFDDDLLCASMATWAGAQSEPHTVTAVSTDSDGEGTTMYIKQDGQNTHTTFEGGDASFESMRVDGVNYMKMEGVWYKSADTTTPTTAETSAPDFDFDRYLDESQDDQSSESNVTYTRLGDDPCGSETCVKYEIKTKDGEEDSTTLIWVHPKHNRVMRLAMNEADGSGWDMSYEYGDVTIVAPADAKDFSEMFNL